jgi:hypothetical protein
MSFYAFYDYTSAGRRGPGLMLVPAQKALRRIMRPAFFRLRDLLQLLSDRLQHEADRTSWVSDRLAVLEKARLEERLHHLELTHQTLTQAYHQLEQSYQTLLATHTELLAVHRALVTDHLAASRRVVMLEDMILQAANDRVVDAGAPWIVPMPQSEEARDAARLAS